MAPLPSARSVTALRTATAGLDRVAAFASGVAYAVIFVLALEILLGSGASSGSPKKPTAGVLGWPAGTWIVGLVGVILCGVALYQGYRGISKDFLKDSKTEQMSRGMRKWITGIGVFGHLARMVVFGMIGVFLISAAVEYDPNKAIGLGRGARQARQPLVRLLPARDRGDRPDRVRALLAERRSLPPHLSCAAARR